MNDFEAFAYSWAITMLKQVVGTDEVRKKILKYYLKDHPILQKYDIIYGPTFSVHETHKQLFTFFKKVTKLLAKRNSLILFTINNSFGDKDYELKETHYQTFIVNTNTKTIIMIDPSRLPNGKGLYHPYASMLVYHYFKKYCKIFWLNLKHPCQVEFTDEKDNDIFCQTWSLYLQKEAILQGSIENPDNIIQIPKDLKEKYQILADFYREIVKIPLVKKDMIYSWKHILKDKEVIKQIEEKSETSNYVEDLKNLKKENIIKLIESIEPTDLYLTTSKIKTIKYANKYTNRVSKTEIERYKKDITKDLSALKSTSKGRRFSKVKKRFSLSST